MGGGPKGDDRTCNGNPQICLFVSHIYWLFRLTVSLSSSLLYRLIPNGYYFIACLYFYCNDHSLVTLNWWQKRSVRRRFSFGCLCLRVAEKSKSFSKTTSLTLN